MELGSSADSAISSPTPWLFSLLVFSYKCLREKEKPFLLSQPFSPLQGKVVAESVMPWDESGDGEAVEDRRT